MVRQLRERGIRIAPVSHRLEEVSGCIGPHQRAEGDGNLVGPPCRRQR